MVLGNISLSKALQQLIKLANEKIFQPKAEPAPIQVLGLLEASGLSFSHLWVAGLHAGVWPGTPRLNPFLPYTLQRQYKFSHADAEVELAYAHRVSNRLLHSADSVLVSCPSRKDDQTLSPSPLFANLPCVDANTLNLEQGLSYARVLHQHRPPLQVLLDFKAPEIGDQVFASGGGGFANGPVRLPIQRICPS
jgi:ATP-dependent helicase/nuclease subunit B